MEPSHKLILTLLEGYSEKVDKRLWPLSEEEYLKEKETLSRFREFLKSSTGVFSRQNLYGHFCGSAWVVNPGLDKIVLTHHRKLGIWIQLGGHADDDHDLYRVALKEAEEESGLHKLRPVLDEEGRVSPIDFAIHEIPAYKDVPAHLHFDVTFAFLAEDEGLVRSDESHDLRWFRFEEAFRVCSEDMHTQLRKLKWVLESY